MALLASLLVGCTVYHPGSFTAGAAFAGQRATVGCLDVAVARRADRESSAVLQYQFGNRCNRDVEVALGRVAVIARFADGSEEALVPYDPRFQIRPARLSGRLTGQEAIAYPTPRRALQVCADLSTITPAAVAHAAARRPGAPSDPDAPAAPSRWLCFAADSHAPSGAAVSGIDDIGTGDTGPGEPDADAGSGAAGGVALEVAP